MSIPRYPGTNEKSRQRTVLLVEDEPFVREATVHILQSAGFGVLSAGDAKDALRVYGENQRRIDLLMSDLMLPGGNGRQLGQDIRRNSPLIPILLTSGYLCADAEQESPDDLTYYLPKPYTGPELVGKLAQIFRVPRRVAAQAG